MTIYPWQQAVWDYLSRCWQQQHLPHAILLHGIAGLGKSLFAQQFAALLLCQQPLQQPETKLWLACQQCAACQLLQAGNHLDYLVVQPTVTSSAATITAAMIKVEQIRELLNKLQYTAARGGYQVVIIQQADHLNLAAANAFLKTLEEPVGNTLMMLVADQLFTIPATILSRCQLLNIPRPTYTAAISWLTAANNSTQPAMIDLALLLADGAPLQAVSLLKSDYLAQYQQLIISLTAVARQQLDPLISAQLCLSYPWSRLLRMFLQLTILAVQNKLLVVRATASDETQHPNPPSYLACQYIFNELLLLTQPLQLESLFNFYQKLLLLQQEAFVGLNYNQQLACEALLLDWAQLFY